jgi:hypothetical protein
MDLSRVCRDLAGEPKPHGCTGCPCWCHSVAPPADFRARVKAAKDAAREAR